jgi:carbonic anhydrase
LNRDVTKLHAHNERHLSIVNIDIEDTERDKKLEEVHVLTQTDWLRKQPNVLKAIKERGLQIHAFVYDKEKNECVRLVESKAINGVNGEKSIAFRSPEY